MACDGKSSRTGMKKTMRPRTLLLWVLSPRSTQLRQLGSCLRAIADQVAAHFLERFQILRMIILHRGLGLPTRLRQTMGFCTGCWAVRARRVSARLMASSMPITPAIKHISFRAHLHLWLYGPH